MRRSPQLNLFEESIMMMMMMMTIDTSSTVNAVIGHLARDASVYTEVHFSIRQILYTFAYKYPRTRPRVPVPRIANRVPVAYDPRGSLC